MASSLAKEAGSTSTAGSNRTGSDRGSRENKCSDGMPSTEDRVCSMQLIYYGYR